MSKAADKRYAGIKAVGEATVTTDSNGNTFHGTRTEIASRIRELAPLGRTARWVKVIEDWAQAVETEESLEWAFLQYSVWACHAAE